MNIIKLHMDIIFLECREQMYITIQYNEVACYMSNSHVNITILHADMIILCLAYLHHYVAGLHLKFIFHVGAELCHHRISF